jgi:hypothetical protein
MKPQLILVDLQGLFKVGHDNGYMVDFSVHDLPLSPTPVVGFI